VSTNAIPLNTVGVLGTDSSPVAQNDSLVANSDAYRLALVMNALKRTERPSLILDPFAETKKEPP